MQVQKIPPTVAETDLSRMLAKEGLVRIHQGKVRDTYELEDGLLLVVATDRLSAFDFVLNVTVPGKGELLSAMTAFWLKGPLGKFKNHLLVVGEYIDVCLPPNLRWRPELRKRSIVVDKLDIVPIECIVRGYLTGSGWRDYQANNGMVCGIQLPEGLHDGSRLPEPLFTPSTKAQEGHDENINAEDVVRGQGEWLRKLSLEIYQKGAAYALSKGIILADTKFEFGRDGTLADEVLTPDSSRLWDVEQYEKAVAIRKAPPGFDKEPVRQYLLSLKTPFGKPIKDLDPTNQEHVEWVQSLEIPQDSVVNPMIERNHIICKRLLQYDLPTFQDMLMGAKA